MLLKLKIGQLQGRIALAVFMDWQGRDDWLSTGLLPGSDQESEAVGEIGQAQETYAEDLPPKHQVALTYLIW